MCHFGVDISPCKLCFLLCYGLGPPPSAARSFLVAGAASVSFHGVVLRPPAARRDVSGSFDPVSARQVDCPAGRVRSPAPASPLSPPHHTQHTPHLPGAQRCLRCFLRVGRGPAGRCAGWRLHFSTAKCCTGWLIGLLRPEPLSVSRQAEGYELSLAKPQCGSRATPPTKLGDRTSVFPVSYPLF